MPRTFDLMQLGSIELFCRAAELESFTSAAVALGVTPAAVSRSVARLEERLGVRLFVRTTRKIRLTDEGQLYWSQCQQALQQIADASSRVSGQQITPSGLLRISAPSTYAYYRIFPRLPEFALAYPKLNIDISICNQNIDFVEENFDLAIRLGVPQDNRLVAVKLENATLGVFASPDFLKRRRQPKTVQDLEKQPCSVFILPGTGRPMLWLFQEGGQHFDLTPRAGIKVYEDALGCLHYALAGGGFVQTYHFIAQAFVQRGELVEVLQDFGARSRQFSILYPKNRHLSSKVRVFIDFWTAHP
jgi:DNA-binding transcriptional LysR family regulator